MLPPNMYVLVRGSGLVLTASTVVSGAAGVFLGDLTIALNSLGFVGVCALSLTVLFYSIALERIGVKAALEAANKVVAVLGISAGVMTVILFALLGQARFRTEASRFGVHSLTGVVVLGLLVAFGAALWRDR